MFKLHYVLVAGVLLCGGCDKTTLSEKTDHAAGQAAEKQADEPAQIQEATSFSGKPLYRRKVDPARLAELEELIEALEQRRTRTEDDYIALGSYYISSGKFNDAIDAYTRGLIDFPESFKLRRHRGHRLISIRQLDKAAIDLNEAVELMGDTSSDSLQYDISGNLNGTYEHWVWYHIGLLNYLNGNYAAAAAAYEKCTQTATNNDILIGSVDWLYNAYQSNQEPAKATAALELISPDIDARTDQSYYKRVMLYKGVLEPAQLLDIDKPAEDWTVSDITAGYGVANWSRFNGDVVTAEKIYKKILATRFWSAWAYVVTDKEKSD